MKTNKPDLTKITSRFGKAYASAKKATLRQTQLQAALFEAFSQHLEDTIRSQQVVQVQVPEGSTLEEYVTTMYPGWRIKRVISDQEIVIEDDPAYMKFSFVNEDDGMVYARTVVQGSTTLDVERVKQENPELWESITEWPEPWYSLINNFGLQVVTKGAKNPSQIVALLDEYLENTSLGKVLKNADDWTTEELQGVIDYMVPGKVSVKLVPPRPAKDEEKESVK